MFALELKTNTDKSPTNAWLQICERLRLNCHSGVTPEVNLSEQDCKM